MDGLHIGRNPLERWTALVDGAGQSVHVAMYKLTSHDALDALIRAQKRGVEISIIADGQASEEDNSLIHQAEEAGLKIWKWPSERLGKLHVKLTIIDSSTAVYGSFNLTQSAGQRNTELLCQTLNKEIVRQAMTSWEALRDSCRNEAIRP